MVLFLSNEGQVADSEGVGSLGAYSFLLLEQQISFKRQDSLLPLTHVKTLFPFASSVLTGLSLTVQETEGLSLVLLRACPTQEYSQKNVVSHTE